MYGMIIRGTGRNMEAAGKGIASLDAFVYELQKLHHTAGGREDFLNNALSLGRGYFSANSERYDEFRRRKNLVCQGLPEDVRLFLDLAAQ